MPKYLSAFTACGHLRLSSAPSLPERYYDMLSQLYGATGPNGVYNLTPGSHMDATIYAKAFALARADGCVTRAGNQQNPLRAFDMLPQLEADFQVAANTNTVFTQRQANLAAKKILPRGAVFTNVVAGLRNILGSNFLAYVPLTTSQASVWPVWTSTYGESRVKCTSVAVPAKVVMLADVIAEAGTVTVPYTNVDPTTDEVDLVPGDVVVVQPDNGWVAETVTVLSTTPTVAVTATTPAVQRTFTAVFVNAHDVGAAVTTQNWPYQWSTQHQVFVVVKSSVAVDAESRRQVNQWMGQVQRGPTQWAIVEPSSTTTSGGTIGPLLLGVSELGATPLGTFTYTNSP